MTCLSDGLLRARIDGEMEVGQQAETDQHLSGCASCRKRLERLALEAERIQGALASLDVPAPLAEDARRALAHFAARQENDAGRGGMGLAIAGFFAAHPVSAWGSAAIAALVVVLITLAPARSLGQRVLAMLRVQRVAVVPINFNFAPGSNTAATIQRLLSDQVVETLSPAKPQKVANAAQASQLAGFPVRTLSDESSSPAISVEGEHAFVMTLDRNRLQEVFAALGRPDLQLPASVNGTTIAVHIPKAVFVEYGDCPHRGPSQNGSGSAQSPETTGVTGCVRMAQVPSPIVSVPNGLNVSQLAEIVLEATGMTQEEAETFCQTVDWRSTLVIPIPSRASSYSQVSVDGVEGTLITTAPRRGRPAAYSLIWVKSGIIYAMMGFGNSENALTLAGSLS